MKVLALLALLLTSSQAFTQELEPRRWSWLPDGANFLGFAAGNSTGDVLFDPVLKLRDVKLDYATLGASYIHSFGFFGKSARIDINLPYASARWEGFLNDLPASTRRRGLIDPYLRFSINLYGAPPLKGRAFQKFMAEHPVNTTIGAAIAVISPWGEYRNDKLINLGNNRWALRPQLGVLHAHNKWQFETTAAVFLYADNREFYPGEQLREQDPLWSIQGHVIHTFRPGLWVSVSGGFAWGGESTVGHRPIGDESRMPLWALSFGVPITPRQGVKFAYLISRTHTDTGSDLGTFQLAWSTMLGH